MSTVNVSTTQTQTDATDVEDSIDNVNITTKGTVTASDVTSTAFITKESENKTETLIKTTNAHSTRKESAATNRISSASSINTDNDNATDVTYFKTPQYVTTDATNVTFYKTSKVRSSINATDITFDKTSKLVTFNSSTDLKSSTVKIDANTTSNFSSNTIASGMATLSSSVEMQKICSECTATIVIVSVVSACVVLLVLLTSVLCFFRLRHKWRAKIQLERKKTDIWSMATYNNTIINENFNDYQLAAPKNKDSKKSSRKSDNSNLFYYPSPHAALQAQFSYDDDSIVLRSDTLPPEVRLENSTLRRNTVSAPEELGLQVQELQGEPKMLGFNENRYTLRGRSSTFTVGRKQNVDRHVLLSHEEVLENQPADGHTNAVYKTPTNSYYMTEL